MFYSLNCLILIKKGDSEGIKNETWISKYCQKDENKGDQKCESVVVWIGNKPSLLSACEMPS